MSALRSQAAEVVDAELLRLSTRLPDLDARARAEIARTVHRVVDKLLHEPTVRVKELAAAPGGTDYAGALRALFGLGIDAEVDETLLPRPSRSTRTLRAGRRRDDHGHRSPRPCGSAPGPARSPAPSRRRSPTRSPPPPGRRSSWCPSSPRATAPSAAIAQLGGTGVFVAAIRARAARGQHRPRGAQLQGPARRRRSRG